MIPIRNRCQFSWYCDGKSDKIHNEDKYRTIYRLARMLLNQDMVDITTGATHYHAYYVSPSWAKTKTRTTKIEDHIFYKWEK
jgi:spore germination cell wall hydrolase CwlJ-like protein